MISPAHILVVDDDRRLRSLLTQYLSNEGYAVSEAASAAEARELLSLLKADLVVLDVMMPDETGLEFAAGLSSIHRPPILMLTAMDAPQDRINGLEVGVEDYLTKPFEPRELLLRMTNILRSRKRQSDSTQKLRFGPFEFDFSSQQLMREKKMVALTGAEAALLAQLATQPGMALSRETLARGLEGGENSRGVDVQIGRLRKKIEEDSAQPRYILTARGEGYRLML
jgi:two-component system phosphate regulon response regulator OmpR